MISPLICAVPLMSPNGDFFFAGCGGGDTRAMGRPFLVTSMGSRVFFIRSKSPRQVALNLDIEIVSMSLFYYGHGLWSILKLSHNIIRTLSIRG